MVMLPNQNNISRRIFKDDFKKMINQDIPEHYIKTQQMKYAKSKNKRISSQDFIVPKLKEYNKLLQHNYSVVQLKAICKHYKQTTTGKKADLIKRAFHFLRYSSNCVKIQQTWRKFIIYKFIKLQGPAIKQIDLCTNATDFLSLEPLNTIPQNQFFSFNDADGFIYGFNVKSLYNLIQKSDNPTNPYNRQKLHKRVICDLKKMLRFGNILDKKISTDIKPIKDELTIKQKMELLTISIFQKMDSFGHITDSNWFTTLTKFQLIKLIHELIDIWDYRAGLTNNDRIRICPPNGRPFYGFNLTNSYLNSCPLIQLKMQVLRVFEILLTRSHDAQQHAISAYYILGALTLVNPNAASALPWLYESMNYIV